MPAAVRRAAVRRAAISRAAVRRAAISRAAVRRAAVRRAGTTMAVVTLAACASDALETVDPAIFDAEPTWTADIQPMFDRHCVRCHDGVSSFDGGLELATWEAARGTRIPDACTASSQELIDAFADVLVLPTEYGDGQPCPTWAPLSMPPGADAHLSTAEQVVLLRWIETGAPR